MWVKIRQSPSQQSCSYQQQDQACHPQSIRLSQYPESDRYGLLGLLRFTHSTSQSKTYTGIVTCFRAFRLFLTHHHARRAYKPCDIRQYLIIAMCPIYQKRQLVFAFRLLYPLTVPPYLSMLKYYYSVFLFISYVLIHKGVNI